MPILCNFCLSNATDALFIFDKIDGRQLAPDLLFFAGYLGAVVFLILGQSLEFCQSILRTNARRALAKNLRNPEYQANHQGSPGLPLLVCD